MTWSAGDQRGYQEAELIGDFKAVGRELEPKGKPVQVRTHDFKDKDLGHAILYGVLDLTRDEGWVNVGIDRDTAQFAAASIRDWWESLGKERYPNATELTVTADSGGSNSYRTRLWNVEPGKLVDATGLRVIVCHFPPGTGAPPGQLHELQPTTRRREHHTQPIPRRVELHHRSFNYQGVSPETRRPSSASSSGPDGFGVAKPEAERRRCPLLTSTQPVRPTRIVTLRPSW